MFRPLAAVFILAFFGAACGIEKFRYVPDDFIFLFRGETKYLFRSLSESDASLLKELQEAKTNYTSDEEALQALKSKSNSLHTEFLKYYKLCRAEVEPLTDEAKDFVKEVVEKIRSLKPEDGGRYKKRYIALASAEILYKYNNLSDAAKEDIKSYLGLGNAIKRAISSVSSAGGVLSGLSTVFSKFF
ncbi:hypothetical protein L596_025297 [Steinernema carpocapsae]|uniref:Fatty-acid and retinol-binding protein 1 n=1 Tax=Steinernema carpocapsae TaxID=34508 RepID=A0A4U5M7D9_STECR|nr:hypothetical protein L596_025297 [Steinernema carpocapsae]